MMAAARPAMRARDSSGRQVSLLNDEPPSGRHNRYETGYCRGIGGGPDSSCSNSCISEASSPTTPDLLRSDSYDSRNSNDPGSPITPLLMEYGRQGSYANSYQDLSMYDNRLDRTPAYGSCPPKPHHSSTGSTGARLAYPEPALSPYDDDVANRNIPERAGSSSAKRYPCRFKDSHGCDKSFTTSGHASRHSKIHTAEKAVHCSFPNCLKKFTRADNMKQHLETHYKERSRSSTIHRLSISSSTKLTMPAGVKKPSSRISRPASRNNDWPEQLSVDTTTAFSKYSTDRYSSTSSYTPQSPATSPKSSYGALDMGNFRNALPSQLFRVPRPGSSSGLDALAAVVAREAAN